MQTKKLTDAIKHIQILLFAACISSCDHSVDNQNDNLGTINCNNLKTGIINMNLDVVKSEINKLLSDMTPIKTTDDDIGHKNNLDLLVQQMNSQCNNIITELICYACIDVYPPISEILTATDSSGTIIRRIIDISTPPDAELSCIRIHE